jgi:hypothetical protein
MTAFMSMRLLQPEEMSHSRSVNATLGKSTNMLSHRDLIELDTKCSVLHSMYQTAEYSPVATNKNKLRIVGYRKEFLSSGDLREFMT